MESITLFTNTYPQDLETKKNWYSHVAQTYDYIRPRYPQEIINQTLKIANLPKSATILEIGCGPGIATLPYAKLGYQILALEPSLPTCELAQQNLVNYPHVQFLSTTFEEFTPEKNIKFDAILSANSWHWLNPEIAYYKTFELLKDNGVLILLWNMTPQLNYHLYQSIREIYQKYAPSLDKYETMEHQSQIIQNWAKNTINYGKFYHLNSQEVICTSHYNIDNYLLLLSTFTPYLKIDLESRNSLFTALKSQIHDYHLYDNLGNIQVRYISACQVFKKVIS